MNQIPNQQGAVPPQMMPTQAMQQQTPPQQPAEQKCIFCEIVNRNIDSRIIYENDEFVVFLDIQPKSVGHSVIVPKKHVAEYTELTDAEIAVLGKTMKTVCSLTKEKLKATGYAIISTNGLSANQTVPHFAMHIIPTYNPNNIELPIWSMIQGQKVPNVVLDELHKLLKKTPEKKEDPGYSMEGMDTTISSDEIKETKNNNSGEATETHESNEPESKSPFQME